MGEEIGLLMFLRDEKGIRVFVNGKEKMQSYFWMAGLLSEDEQVELTRLIDKIFNDV